MHNEHDLPVDRGSNGRVVEIWSLILRHLVLIIFMGGVGAGLGYLLFVRTPPTYQSDASLHVRNESKNQTIPFQGNDNAVSVQTEQPHSVLIVSPSVVEKALEMELGDADGNQKMKRRLRDLPFFAGLDNPTEYIISRLNARPGMQNGGEIRDIINLTYRDHDALTTKAVLDAVIASYQSYLGESHKSVSNQVLELIQDARDSLMKQLAEIETEYMQFQQDTPLLFNGEDRASNVHKERMNEIESARKKLLILVTERRAELDSINEALSHGGSRDAITLMLLAMKPDARAGEAGIKSPASEIFQLKMEEAILLQDLGADHPKVKTLQKKLAMTEEFFLSQETDDDTPGKRSRKNDFLTICLDSIKHEIRSIEARIAELDGIFENERYESKSIAAYEFKNQKYQKDVERTEALYQRIIKRLDELNLLQDYGGYKTNVISPPSIGVFVAPVFSQYLAIGAVCGAALGFGLAYLAEANDKTFRSPEEVSEQLGLPVVGHIPVIDRVASNIRTTSVLDKTLITFFRPKSRTSESYRAIRTSLYFSTRGEQHKVIQITSPNPGDGKTTLSANLAVSIAQSGKRVLIIDADFRRPRIHDLFGLDKSIGMSSVITGEAELPDAIQVTEVENLWGLPCGPRPNNPCELLTSRRFEELLDILREQYDFVIIDTPPVLAVTDPSAVAARVDGVIVTIRLSKRTRGESLRAIDLLNSVGANTLGVVVNGSGKKSSYGYNGYGTYGAYNYRYGGTYGSEGENPYYSDENNPGDEPEVAAVPGRRSRRQPRNT